MTRSFAESELMIALVQAFGGPTPTSNGPGELLNDLINAVNSFVPGDSWPAKDATGPGNLVAETPTDDTVGYSMTAQGSGLVSFFAAGSGNAFLGSGGTGSTAVQATGSGFAQVSSAGAGLYLLNGPDPGSGTTIADNSGEAVVLQADGGVHDGGSISISTTGGGATTGITLSTQATDTGGINLTDSSTAGIAVLTSGLLALNATAGIQMVNSTGTAGLVITNTNDDGLEISDSSLGGIILSEQGDGFVRIETTGATPSGISIVTGATDTAGVSITDLSANGISIGGAGTGPVGITGLAGITLSDDSNAGVLINASGSGGISLTTTENLVLTGDFIGLYDASPVAQPGAITAPTGGAIIDAECRAAVASILTAIGTASGGIGITA